MMNMQAKLGVYEQAVKWFRNADEDELQRGFEQIGAFEHPMDFSCVWLILESYYYGVPYLA